MGIKATNVYANRRCSRWVIHDVPAHIGTTNTTEVSNLLADEFHRAVGVSRAHALRWMNAPEVLRSRERGTVMISIPGNVTIPKGRVPMFNHSCCFESATPDHPQSQCHKCQPHGHHDETCTKESQCAVGADKHETAAHKCLNTSYPEDMKCNRTPIRCAKCRIGPAGSHKTMDHECAAPTKFFLQVRPTDTRTALD